MDTLLINVLIPLGIGVATPFIVDWIRKLLNRESLSSKERIILGAIVTVGLIVALLFLPPYRVSNINWCSDANQSVHVTGRITASLLGTPVNDVEIQVKLFPIGGDRPIFSEKFARTSAEGIIEVIFPPLPLPLEEKGYLVNAAYKYSRYSFWEKWQITDFRPGDLIQCPSP